MRRLIAVWIGLVAKWITCYGVMDMVGRRMPFKLISSMKKTFKRYERGRERKKWSNLRRKKVFSPCPLPSLSRHPARRKKQTFKDSHSIYSIYIFQSVCPGNDATQSMWSIWRWLAPLVGHVPCMLSSFSHRLDSLIIQNESQQRGSVCLDWKQRFYNFHFISLRPIHIHAADLHECVETRERSQSDTSSIWGNL